MFKTTRRVVGLFVIAYVLLGTATGARLVAQTPFASLVKPSAAVSQPARSADVKFTSRTSTGAPVVWAPCATVDVLVNPGTVPGAAADLAAALREVSAMTGLNMRIAGVTDKTPSRRWYAQPGIAPVLVGFVNSSDLLITGDALGSTVANPAGDHIVTGAMAISAAKYNELSKSERHALLLHELGHLVGLDHTDAASDLMYPTVSSANDDGFNAAVKAYLAQSNCRA